MSHGVPPEAVVTMNIAIVLMVGLAMVQLLRRLNQPPVVAEIAAGLMLGPSLLGLLPGDLPSRLFPDSTRPMLASVAEVGILVFMFLVGWEMDLSRLRIRRRALVSIAGMSMALPCILGAGAAFLLLSGYRGDQVSTEAFVLYMGMAFAITAFPVLARIIRDSRLSATALGATAIACAAVGDVVAWCALVLVLAMVESSHAGQFFVVIALAVTFGLLIRWVVRPALRGLTRRLIGGVPTGSILALIVAGVFVSAYVSSWIGIHAIFGAFAFGAAMPRGDGPELQDKIAAPLEKIAALLLPVFFIVIGLSVDIGGLGWSGFAFMLVITVVAVVGKVAGATIPARISGMSWRESVALGSLMNTRGLTEIVILNIGRERGIIDPEMFSMMVVMALVTTAMTGPLIRVLGVSPPPGRADVVDAVRAARENRSGRARSRSTPTALAQQPASGNAHHRMHK